jgi:hypothetical protein
MENAPLPLGQSLADKHRAAELKWRGMPPGLPPEMAEAIMLGLRSGERTLADYYRDTSGPHYSCSLDRLNKHCGLNPAWAEEARRLSAQTTIRRKRDNGWLTNLTVCRNGLHAMTPDNIKETSWGRRLCKACSQANSRRVASPLTEQEKQRVKDAIAAGATLSTIIRGRLPGGKKTQPFAVYKDIAHARKTDAAFDAFVSSHLPENRRRNVAAGYKLHLQRLARSQREQDAKDYFEIATMIPRWFPEQDKFDVVNDVMAELSAGKITRDELRVRIKFYMGQATKMFAPKFRKFGDAKLVSLDEVLFDDGSATIGDTVSRGLWD